MKFFPKLRDESVDLIVSDVPYPCQSCGSLKLHGGILHSNLDGFLFDYNDIAPRVYASHFYRVLKDGTPCYIMTNHYNLQTMLSVFTSVGFKFTQGLIWDKGNKILSGYYMSRFEYILFFRKGSDRRINHPGTSTILSFPNKKTKGADGKPLHLRVCFDWLGPFRRRCFVHTGKSYRLLRIFFVCCILGLSRGCGLPKWPKGRLEMKKSIIDGYVKMDGKGKIVSLAKLLDDVAAIDRYGYYDSKLSQETLESAFDSAVGTVFAVDSTVLFDDHEWACTPTEACDFLRCYERLLDEAVTDRELLLAEEDDDWDTDRRNPAALPWQGPTRIRGMGMY